MYLIFLNNELMNYFYHNSYADKVVPGFPAKELGLLSHADELQYFFLYDGYQKYRMMTKSILSSLHTLSRCGLLLQQRGNSNHN